RQKNLGWRRYSRALLEENKWRASRYGVSGKLIDFGKNREVEMKQLTYELMEFVDDVVDELGSRKEISYLETILKNGTGADRQLKVFEETGDLRAVVDYLIGETMQDVDINKADELLGARIKTGETAVT
ncbi:MAG: hypothetical protein JOY51_08970, partial [Nevskia sp.]|nr:hypothetical protein [Nevskia sp.]